MASSYEEAFWLLKNGKKEEERLDRALAIDNKLLLGLSSTNGKNQGADGTLQGAFMHPISASASFLTVPGRVGR